MRAARCARCCDRAGSAAQARPPAPSRRRPCGCTCSTAASLKIADPMPLFGLKKEEVGATDLSDAAYLIVHPRGTLMWEAGLVPDAHRIRRAADAARRADARRLKELMAEVGYRPSDVTYLAMSHGHGDHTANANDFQGSTWLVNKAEYDAMFPEKAPRFYTPATYAALKNSMTKFIDGDYDVFGDGTVVIKQTPGHTPGHQVVVRQAEEHRHRSRSPATSITIRKRSAARKWRRRRATRRVTLRREAGGGRVPQEDRRADVDYPRPDRILEVEEVSGVLRLAPVGVLQNRRAAVERSAWRGRCALTGHRGRRTIHGADAKKTGEWPFYSADNRSTKYSAARSDQQGQRRRSLRVAWRRPQADPALLEANPGIRLSNRYTATPIMVNGVLYVPDGFGLVEAHRSRRPAGRCGRRSRSRRAGRSAGRRRPLGRRVLEPGRRGAHLQHARPVSVRARREDRRADRRFR